MAAHTLGPWAVSGEGAIVCRISRAVDVTAPCVSRHDRPDDERIDADARLVAEAPAMLAFVERVRADKSAYQWHRAAADILARIEGR